MGRLFHTRAAGRRFHVALRGPEWGRTVATLRSPTTPPPIVPIQTDRLCLVEATAPLLLAEMEGPGALARLLGARVGDEWPPPLYDADAVEWALDQVRLDARCEEWGMRYMRMEHSDEGGREVVGVAGYKGPPDADGRVEIGYSVVPTYHRRGLASEAVAALVAHAAQSPEVTCVVAHTLRHLAPSMGVLRKSGFERDETFDDDGVVRFVRVVR